MKAIELYPYLRTTGRACIRKDALTLDWSFAKAEFEGDFDDCVLMASLSLAYGELADLLVVIDDDFDRARKHTLTANCTALADYALADLPAGHHIVALYKATQARSGGINLHEISFSGRLCMPGEHLTGKPRIQIIGDSISCGAGAVPTERPESCADIAEYCYGALLARNLPAEVSILAVSGWGIACGGHNEKALIPSIFEKTNFFRDPADEWDFSGDSPDFLIVALGTNDYRFASEHREDVLRDASHAFLARLRAHYPHARILWVYGQMLDQYNDMLRDMVASFNDPHMTYMDLPRNVAGGFGHPNAVGHEAYAQIIGDWIRNQK